MNLTEAALRRPVTTMMVFVSLVTVGLISTRLLPMEYFPEMTMPGIFINLPYPGSTPEEVERLIVRPAEEAVATISGIKRMQANANEGGGSLFLMFDWETDTDLKALEVREKLDGIRHSLPPDFERFFVYQQSTSDWAILELRISSSRDLSGAYELLDRKLKRPVERIEGISQVTLYGVERKEVRIELLADRVAAHRVDLARLVETLQGSNFSVTAGRITDGGRRFMVRPVGELTTPEAIGGLVVGENGLRLRDIARVVYDDPELEYGRHLNRTYAVGLEIKKEAGANTIAATEAVLAELAALEDDPEMEGIELFFFHNMAEGIQTSLSDLLESGLIGALFALVVLFFFLRHWGTTFVVALAVPVSLLITLGVLYFMGLTLNVLTMMGLMLAIGMLVDNAVVVTESVHRHQHLHPGDPREATLRGVREVALAVTAGTLTTAIVFLPFIVSPADEVTTFLKHVSVTICTALGVSLLLSLTIVPIFTARIQPKPKPEGGRLVDRLEGRYGRLLDGLLRRRWLSALLIVLTLGSVALPAQFVSMDFFPDENTDRQLRLHYHLTGTYRLERVEETVDKVEDYLFANQDAFEIESVYSYYQPQHAMSTITLREADRGSKSVQEIEELIRAGLPKLSIARPTFTWQSSSQGQPGIRLTLSGESSERLAALSREVAAVLERVPGFQDVRSEAEQGEEEVHVVVDRARARQYGFTTQQVARNVSAAMRGQNLRRLRTPEGEVELRIQFREEDRATLAHLQNLSLQRPDGAAVQLAALADLQRRSGPRGIRRENRATMIGIQANLDGITMPEARTRLQQVMSQYTLPPGYEWGFGEQFRQEEQSQQIMLMNILLALVLIYLVMAALFESLIHPAAIWTSILFAIVGVFWFFLITGTTFSIMAWIGVLILIGVVVNNGIVLIDHINHHRGAGLARHEAIVQAGRERLRPILMTAATTVLGLIPLCIGATQIGGDGPPYYPMARAIVGGLTFSTLVTLVILPAIYIMLDDLRIWGRRLVHEATRT